MLRSILFAVFVSSGTAFQISPPARLPVAASRNGRSVAPAMGLFDFLAAGKAGAKHILVSDRSYATKVMNEISAGDFLALMPVLPSQQHRAHAKPAEMLPADNGS
jgi:hypothetical protein